jgi:branched-subunit amino acid ABC-type transport system permease component
MSEYITFLLVGLGVGTAYATIALGLVVTYKGTGIINLAAGAMGRGVAVSTTSAAATGTSSFRSRSTTTAPSATTAHHRTSSGWGRRRRSARDRRSRVGCGG